MPRRPPPGRRALSPLALARRQRDVESAPARDRVPSPPPQMRRLCSAGPRCRTSTSAPTTVSPSARWRGTSAMHADSIGSDQHPGGQCLHQPRCIGCAERQRREQAAGGLLFGGADEVLEREVGDVRTPGRHAGRAQLAVLALNRSFERLQQRLHRPVARVAAGNDADAARRDFGDSVPERPRQPAAAPIRVGRERDLHRRLAVRSENKAFDHGEHPSLPPHAEPDRRVEVDRGGVRLDRSDGHAAQEAQPQVIVGKAQEMRQRPAPRVAGEYRDRSGRRGAEPLRGPNRGHPTRHGRRGARLGVD